MVVFQQRGARATFGAPSEQAGLERLHEILEDRLRVSDIAGPLDTGLTAVLLPETSASGAHAMADGVLLQLADAHLRFDVKVYHYGGDGNGNEWNQTGTNGNGHVGFNQATGNGSAPVAPAAASGGAAERAPASNGHAEEAARASERTQAQPANGESVAQPTGGSSGGQKVKPAAEIFAINDRAWTHTRYANRKRNELSEVRSSMVHDFAEDLKPLCYPGLSFRRRAFDIVVAGGMLIVLSPLLLLIAVAVTLTSAGPAIYTQKRAGQGGEPFDFYKFRSMYQDADQRKKALAAQNEQDGPIFKMKDDPRMTPLGKFLRRTSLDELPQLFNVLRGDMTLVGPRPPTLDEVKKYLPWQRARLSLKGGLTCIWQVSGRSEIGFDEWVRMDLRYVQRRDLAMDLSLLARTANAVLTGRGAY